ncbi:bcl-2-associated transcription factor 1 isoform X6 [Pleurodeles waltl]|uniref:bcl-2-associated transcription factor 1 isoform X6 n=1 Tax=Pleurodeles waltl TaxID=8319 RepID=UPI003709B2E3
MGRSNSRSHSSRSKSRSRSSSRSRSRSHSRKKRYSSRSRSRTYSRSRSRERMYNRDSRDFRDNRDYHRDYRNNRGMRRPYGFRPMRRGFFPGGGGGRFMHRGGFRPMWNRRHSRSPRRERSRSRTPKRRSVSSQRSRSRSHRSYRSSRSPRSSSSGSSSQYSKSPVRPKKRISREKKAKKLRSAPSRDSPVNTKSHDEPKDAFERDPSESLDEFSKASGVCVDTWAGLSAYDNSPRSPRSPSPVASPSSLSSSDSDTPILSTAKDTTSPLSPTVQHSPESIDNGSARYSPSQNSPLHHVPSKRSPAKTAPSEESRTGELELSKSGKPGKRPLHKMESRDKSFREDSPLKIKMVASESNRPEVKLKMSTVPLDDVDRSTSLLNDRLLASTLVHSVSKDQEFRSIFDHLKLPQSSKTSSESFIEHIVSLVHHVQEHYFRSAGMSLHERFGGYLKAAEEQAAQQRSPEIHRRIDISPSILKKHTRLADEEKVFKDQATKSDKKLKGIAADKRHEVERRRKHRSKDRGNSKGSRESSGSRKQEKLQKEYKEFKLYKDESKRKNKEQERSPSPSSSSSSREEKARKKEREEEFRSQQEQKDYSVFSGPSRPRGTFHDDRDDGVDYWANRGRGRGTFQRGRGRFTFKKSGSSPKWTHDKYQGDGLVEDEDESMENDEERKDGHKEEKD